MASNNDLVAWLRAEIKADAQSAAARLRRQMSADYERRMIEKLNRAKAELAILDLYEKQVAKSGDNCMEEDRAWALERVIRLLAGGYRHRESCPEEREAELRDFYFLCTEPES